jgi:hypothetical protein
VSVSLSLVLVFGAALGALLRFRAVGLGGAFVAAGFGFYLASTGAAGPVNEIVGSAVEALSHL